MQQQRSLLCVAVFLAALMLSAVGCNHSAQMVPPALPGNVSVSSTFSPVNISSPSISIRPSFTPTAMINPSSTSSNTPSQTPTACIAQSFSLPPTPTPVPDSSVPPLTIQRIKNGTYDVPGTGTVTLVDGEWQDDSGYVYLANFAFGDLDHDGVKDAAIALGQNWGGTMWIQTIFIILNRNGELVQSASRDIAEATGRVTSMTIRQGLLILEESLHDWHDCNQCFSLEAVEVMQFLSDGHLVQRRFSSIHIHDQGRREIQITSPAEGTAVSCSVRMKGSVSFTDFEGLVYYRIQSMTEKELASGSFSIEADRNKAGGMFEVSIDLEMVTAGESVLVSLCKIENDVYSSLHEIDPTVLPCDFINAMDSTVLLVV